MKKDIFTFATTQIERVQKALGTPAGDQTPTQVTAVAVQILKEAISELKAFCRTYQFIDAQEEIRFFKDVKPVLVSQYLYQQERWKALRADSYYEPKQKLTYYTQALGKLQRFAQQNDEFCRYFISGATYLDHHYFTRQPQAAKWVNQDDNFSTSHDSKVAKVLAYEMLREYFVQTIETLQGRDVTDASPIEWTASKAAAIELIYALQSAGAVNNGKADIKSFIAHFERVYKINLGNFYRSFHEMSIRRGSRTMFLDTLKERLLRKFEELDD